LVKRIIVLGGGTAGWITAGLIAKKHAQNATENGINITLIESPDIATVGVGEGTWPTMRQTLAKLGISETTFIRRCQATFKQASKFVNWIAPQNDCYYHPFSEPQGYNRLDLGSYWRDIVSEDCSFSEATTFQHYLCEQGLAPKNIANREYDVVANYGYHLDAGKFIELLHEHCTTNLNVEHLYDTVEQVTRAENGDISTLECKANGPLSADLFVDCTGMRSTLLGETMGVPFIACDDVFLADTALATQVAYPSANSPIASCTISTAQSAGWIWDIGLQQRKGIGYVYSSRHIEELQARETLACYIGDESIVSQARKINFTPGHREVFWQNNCVAVGLSAGFLEPLEASALMLVENSANFIADQLPVNSEQMTLTAKRFNTMMLKKWRGVIDFLKLHYVLSRRTETFWQDSRESQSIPDSLRELLQLWQYRGPNEYDFSDTIEAFSAASYAYILYGAGFEQDLKPMQHLYTQKDAASKLIMLNKKRIDQLKFTLPRHRELIDKVVDIGFSSI
jgi:hypothetical protein